MVRNYLVIEPNRACRVALRQLAPSHVLQFITMTTHIQPQYSVHVSKYSSWPAQQGVISI